jgi:hypothetical protein
MVICSECRRLERLYEYAIWLCHQNGYSMMTDSIGPYTLARALRFRLEAFEMLEYHRRNCRVHKINCGDSTQPRS